MSAEKLVVNKLTSNKNLALVSIVRFFVSTSIIFRKNKINVCK